MRTVEHREEDCELAGGREEDRRCTEGQPETETQGWQRGCAGTARAARRHAGLARTVSMAKTMSRISGQVIGGKTP